MNASRSQQTRSPVPGGRHLRWVLVTVVALALAAVVAPTTAATAAGPENDTAPAVTASDARVVQEVWIDDRTLDIAISSSSHDTYVKWVRLLVPPEWNSQPAQTYPTLWLLHGGLDNHKSWYDNTDIKALSADRNAIVVMPETSWCSAYSDWLVPGGSWFGRRDWQTYLTSEVRQILEDDYRANGTQAVAGNSMGGLGALKFAATGEFEAAASFSGNVDPLHSNERPPDTPPADPEGGDVDLPGLGCGANWRDVWGDPTNPAHYPIWQANNPYDLTPAMQGTDLYVAAGDDSDPVEAATRQQSEAIVAKLEAEGTPVTSHFYEGTHSWSYWNSELTTAFPLLMDAIGA